MRRSAARQFSQVECLAYRLHRVTEVETSQMHQQREAVALGVWTTRAAAYERAALVLIDEPKPAPASWADLRLAAQEIGAHSGALKQRMPPSSGLRTDAVSELGINTMSAARRGRMRSQCLLLEVSTGGTVGASFVSGLSQTLVTCFSEAASGIGAGLSSR